eukprot:517952-Pelagomonas_calceolata.AAC.1
MTPTTFWLGCLQTGKGHYSKFPRKKERKIYACRLAACIKERVSHRLPLIEGIFISTPATRI